MKGNEISANNVLWFSGKDMRLLLMEEVVGILNVLYRAGWGVLLGVQ